MDCFVAGYKQSRYDEIANEMRSTLIEAGWKKDFVENNTPVVWLDALGDTHGSFKSVSELSSMDLRYN